MRKKVEYEVTIKKHGIFEGENEEAVKKEVERQADYQFYQTADSCDVNIIKITNLD